MRPRSFLLMAVVIIAVAVADQWTKALILQNLVPGQVIPVIDGFFNVTLNFNPGAAFGLLAGLPSGPRELVLGLTTLAALTLVIYLLFSHYCDDLIGQFALAMIVGGAVGNLIDRALIGEVVDFLDFYYSTWHWPAFNAADSAICLGVIILLSHPGKTD